MKDMFASINFDYTAISLLLKLQKTNRTFLPFHFITIFDLANTSLHIAVYHSLLPPNKALSSQQEHTYWQQSYQRIHIDQEVNI